MSLTSYRAAPSRANVVYIGARFANHKLIWQKTDTKTRTGFELRDIVSSIG